MRFASGLAALLLLTGTPARANDDSPRDKLDPPDEDGQKTRKHDGEDRRHTSPRTELADQLSAELQAIDHTLGRVGEKLSIADAQRLRRMRAAYRILRAPLAPDASATDRMASARRRAGVRLLTRRDSSERALLAGEASHLRAAQLVTIEASAKVPALALPDELQRPAHGDIARHFGSYEHERSKARLSRRGIDFDVELHAEASAPADGVVRYAGPIRGLDRGVIIDHGDYITVIAKLDDVTLPVGTTVTRGDRLGRANRHRIYLELRAKVGPGGLPIDPEPLLRMPPHP